MIIVMFIIVRVIFLVVMFLVIIGKLLEDFRMIELKYDYVKN